MSHCFAPLSRRIGSMFLLFAVSLLAGCTDDPPTESDTHGPDVRILYPPNQEPPWFHYSRVYPAYIDVYVGARDDQHLDGVSVYHAEPDEEQRHAVGSSGAPIAVSAVPGDLRDQIVLPPDWSLYHVRWQHASCGLERLFATATDGAANMGFADAITIRAKVEDCDKPTVFPDFRIDPPEGSVLTEFTFDAVGPDPDNPLSRSGVDFIHEIAARWDFDGDDRWEFDWDDELVATDRPTHRFAKAGTYAVSLELWDVNQESRRATHTVVVAP